MMLGCFKYYRHLSEPHTIRSSHSNVGKHQLQVCTVVLVNVSYACFLLEPRVSRTCL
jgi:hypothetical protein